MVDEDEVWHQTDECSPFTEESRARVAFAAEARELSDAARGLVPIGGRTTDDLVADAARIAADAQRLLRLAVVAARAANISWQDLGDVLEITRQSAHQRYAEDEHRWKEALARPETVSESGERYSRLPYGAEDTAQVAARLDAWAVQPPKLTDYTGTDPDAPVSGGLRRMGPLEEDLYLSGRVHILLEDHIVPPPEELIPIYERQAVLAERLATAGVEPPSQREAARRLRARAADLRAAGARERTQG